MPKNPKTEDSEDVGQLAKILREVADALSANAIKVKLLSGKEIVGPIGGITVLRKEGKKGVRWSGTVRVQTEPGVLAIECDTIAAVTAG